MHAEEGTKILIDYFDKIDLYYTKSVMISYTDDIHNFSKVFHARKLSAAKYKLITQLKKSILSILISPLTILRNLKRLIWRQTYMRQQPRLLQCVLRLTLRYHKVFSLASKTIFEPYKIPRYLLRKLQFRH